MPQRPTFSTDDGTEVALVIRFYAGAPVVDADGFALGSLCIMDQKPRKLNPEETKILSSLAWLTSEAVQSPQPQTALRKM